MSFGSNLRAMRLTRGWTQQQLANMVGRSKNNISQFERSKREPNCLMLVRLARALSTTTDALLGMTSLPDANGPERSCPESPPSHRTAPKSYSI